jgi:hypothetical protein
MVRRLGTGPQVVVLGWLYAVLASDSPAARMWVRRAQGGERYVHASREEVAASTGLSGDQVKRALERLTREGLVVTSRGDGTTNFVVVPPEET